MPESPGLYLRLTVTENLEYFAGLYGLHHPDARIKEALHAVHLGDRATISAAASPKGFANGSGSHGHC